MMTLYVISGVTGMTGNELARQILKRGDSVIGFDNLFASSCKVIEDIQSHENFLFFIYDINNSSHMEDIKKLVLDKKQRFERVVYINCAAVVHTEYFYHVNTTFETNVLGMKSFLEQAIDVGAEVYINCSTSEVYSMKSWDENGVKEDDVLQLATVEHSQRTSYATGKLMTEFFMKDAVDAGKIKGCSLRFANVYSKNERYPKHIIPYIINQLKADSKVTLLENSKVNRRTFLHNIDSCQAIIEIINSSEALDGSVYNVATDDEISIIDLVKLCALKLNITDPIIEYHGYRESDPIRRILNTDKIRQRIAWRPCISLDQGIQMCVEEVLDGQELQI